MNIEPKQILLATDFSEPSLAATEYAVEFARQFGATLHLLHVIEDPVVYVPIFDSWPLPTREEFEQYAQTRLENWILPDDAGGLDLKFHWAHGRPWAEVVRFAQEHAIDLIVIGTHGRGTAAQLFLGGTAEKVVRRAACPVLTIRPDAHPVEPHE